MDGIEEKLGAVLSNPQLMQQIMTMAQSMSAQAAPAEPPQQPQQVQQQSQLSPLPDIDIGMLQRLSSAASQASIDRDQQTLLKALHPYLSSDRIGRLERAMRAAKMAKLASTFLGQRSFSGR